MPLPTPADILHQLADLVAADHADEDVTDALLGLVSTLRVRLPDLDVETLHRARHALEGRDQASVGDLRRGALEVVEGALAGESRDSWWWQGVRACLIAIDPHFEALPREPVHVDRVRLGTKGGDSRRWGAIRWLAELCAMTGALEIGDEEPGEFATKLRDARRARKRKG